MDLNRFGLIVCMLVLNACVCYRAPLYDKMTTNRACYTACTQRLHRCSRICDQNSALCDAKDYARAAVHFNHYKRQQCVKGDGIEIELGAFRDPLACMKSTCECVQDFDVCVQACRGKIVKRLCKSCPN